MTNQERIAILEARKNKILARGPHNYNIAAKITRKIRQLRSGEDA